MLRASVATTCLLILIGSASPRETTTFRFGGRADDKKAVPSDRAAIVDQLRIKYQDVLDQLKQRDPGADTLAMQKEIAELLKRLLEEGNPPPSNPPSAPKSPMNAPDVAPNRPMPPQKNSPPSQGEKVQSPLKPANRGESEHAAKSLDELKKQLEKEGHWPVKLPPRHRDNIEVSGSGRFMPRYEELLRAYYRTIAESSHSKREE